MKRSIEGVFPPPTQDRPSTGGRLVVPERTPVHIEREIVIPPRQPRSLPINDVTTVRSSSIQAQSQAPAPESSHSAPPKTTKPKPSSRARLQHHSLVSLAAIVLVVTSVIAYQTWRTNVEAKQAFSQPVAAVSSNTATAPTEGTEGTDETKVDDSQKKAYTVSPDMPRMISIPSLKVEARILHMSLTSTGAIQAPKGIWDTGWYDGSAKPGQKGNAFIDGHVSGPTEPAVFRNLKNIAKGAEITIERGDGSTLVYKVQSIDIVKLDDLNMKTVLASPTGMTESLTIMTCGGNYLGDYTYDSRVVVRAERI